MTDMTDALVISTYGMRAQGERTRVISENIANASTGAISPEAEPYSRKVITFENEMDRARGFRTVKVEDITDDRRDDFPLRFMPDHPGANEEGYVQMPNVNMLVELNDMREAQRSYEANLGMVEQSRSMISRTVDLLR